MANQTVLDLPIITYMDEADILYVVRGAGAGRDKQLTAVNGLMPKTLILSSSTPVDLATYGGDVNIVCSGSITVTFSNLLRSGRILNVVNGGASNVVLTGTVSCTLYPDQSMVALSDGAAMQEGCHVDYDPSGNVGIGKVPTSKLDVNGTITGTALDINGTGDVSSTLNVGGNFSVNTNKFTVNATTGNTTIAGTLGVTGATGIDGDFDINTNKFTVTAATGNTLIAGTLGVTGTSTLGNLDCSTLDVTGAVGIDGNFDVATNKFTVNATTGDTLIAGTLGVTGTTTLGDLDVSTLDVTGAFGVDGNFDVATNKFTVDATTGNTYVSGVLGVGNSSPKTWNSALKSIQLGRDGAITGGSASSQSSIMCHLYNDGSFKFLGSDSTYGSLYQQANGIHYWSSTSNQGTDGTSATLVNKMMLTQAGRLHIGTSITERTATQVRQSINSGSTASYIAFETTSSGSGDGNGALIGYSDSTGLTFYNYENTPIEFTTNGVRRAGFAAGGDFDINTNKFNVSYSTGATTIAGLTQINNTLDVNGLASFITSNSSVAIAAIQNTYNGANAGGLTVTTANASAKILSLSDNTGERLYVSGGSLYAPNVVASVSGLIAIDNSGSNSRNSPAALIRSTNANLDFPAYGLLVELPNMSDTSTQCFRVSGYTDATYQLIDGSGQVFFPQSYGHTVTSARDLQIQSDGKIGYVSSSRATKTNIQYEPDTSYLYDFRVVSFEYKKVEDNNILEESDGISQLGLIAEDVEAVNPEFCIYDKEDTLKSVQYSKLIPALLNEIQKLNKRIEVLENK